MEKKEKKFLGCCERLNLGFLKYVLYYNKRKRHFISEAIKNIDTNKFIVFHKQKDLNNWLKEQNIELKKT